jgi:hypothetical protein
MRDRQSNNLSCALLPAVTAGCFLIEDKDPASENWTFEKWKFAAAFGVVKTLFVGLCGLTAGIIVA